MRPMPISPSVLPVISMPGAWFFAAKPTVRYSLETGMILSLIHIYFMLVPSFTVAQNIVMSREPRRLGVLFDNLSLIHI